MTWLPAPALVTLRNQYFDLFPDVPRSLFGMIGDAAHAATKSDHNPDENGIVSALDVPHDPAHGLDIAVESDKLVNTLDPRLKYVIANRRIWEPGKGWKPYTGTDPHTGHMHVSVKASNYDDASAWKITSKARGADMIDNADDLDILWRMATNTPANANDKKAWVNTGKTWHDVLQYLAADGNRRNWLKEVQDLRDKSNKGLTPEQQAKINAAQKLAEAVKELTK